MSFRLSKVVKGYQPVQCVPGGLLAWRRNTLYRADLDLNHFEPICELPIRAAWLAGRSTDFLTRILRFEIRSSVMLDEDTVLLAQRDKLFTLKLSTGEWRFDFEIPNGRRLLALSTLTGANGSRIACFGEYLHNPEGAPVGIWRRDPDGKWTRPAEFPAGSIDHIHNIVETRDGRVWVLVGDMGKRPGFWRSDARLERLEPIAVGEQQFRACWLWQAPDGVCHYAMDSNIEPNFAMRMEPGSDAFERCEPLAGSSIYATYSDNYVAFSTALEPGEFPGRPIRAITARRPAPVFSGHCAHIHVIEGGRLHNVLSAKMDGLPFGIAQFATFYFPAGPMPVDRFFAFGRSVKEYDSACLMFERLD